MQTSKEFARAVHCTIRAINHEWNRKLSGMFNEYKLTVDPLKERLSDERKRGDLDAAAATRKELSRFRRVYTTKRRRAFNLIVRKYCAKYGVRESHIRIIGNFDIK